MSELEFIEREINNLKDFLELDDVLCLQTDEDYKFWYERLQTFQQIKDILEAWEVVNEEIEYNEEKACSERPDIVYSFKHWSFEINEDQGDFEEKSTKLKKALEVNKNGKL